MNCDQEQQDAKRGDRETAVEFTDRRVAMSAVPNSWKRGRFFQSQRGFSLIELVITITVLTILSMGVIPLVKLSVKRQKEQQLRDRLRQIRMAVDEFHRDTVGMMCTGGATQPGGGAGAAQTPYIDPRSKVRISDCTLFGVDNPDRYPPDLETLVNGVNVVPRELSAGGRGLESTGTRPGDTSSTLDDQASTKKKVYLRGIPIDPMTGEADWDLRSCYDDPGADSWGGENVFDVRSKSRDRALNGEKYSDW